MNGFAGTRAWRQFLHLWAASPTRELAAGRFRLQAAGYSTWSLMQAAVRDRFAGKAGGDTRAYSGSDGNGLVCAEPAAILHSGLRHVGGADAAILLNPRRGRRRRRSERFGARTPGLSLL